MAYSYNHLHPNVFKVDSREDHFHFCPYKMRCLRAKVPFTFSSMFLNWQYGLLTKKNPWLFQSEKQWEKGGCINLSLSAICPLKITRNHPNTHPAFTPARTKELSFSVQKEKQLKRWNLEKTDCWKNLQRCGLVMPSQHSCILDCSFCNCIFCKTIGGNIFQWFFCTKNDWGKEIMLLRLYIIWTWLNPRGRNISAQGCDVVPTMGAVGGGGCKYVLVNCFPD